MLVLPVRSPQNPRAHQNHNGNPLSIPTQRQQTSDKQPTPDPQRRASDDMHLVMTSPRLGPQRPKLSLQTSNVSSMSAGHRPKTALKMDIVMQSSTTENTRANNFGVASDIAVMPQATNIPKGTRSIDSSPSSSNSSATTVSPGHSSPFPAATSYCQPIGTRSILRNSPLPRRILTSTTARTAKILFPRVKRVCFHEKLVEIIPTPIIDETPGTSDMFDSDTSDKRLEDEIAERKALDEFFGEDLATPVHGHRKRRRRDWIWRPLENDILVPQSQHISDPGGTAEEVRHCKRMPGMKCEKTAREVTPRIEEQPVKEQATGHFVVQTWVSVGRSPIKPNGTCESNKGHCDPVIV